MNFNSAWERVSEGNEIEENSNNYAANTELFETDNQDNNGQDPNQNNSFTLTVNATNGSVDYEANYQQGATATITATATETTTKMVILSKYECDSHRWTEGYQ